ncbi:MAG: DMT family transporter [Patescibacteria group bacterium]|nr:DMT family transporter [Patescibacteria group bacterium]
MNPILALVITNIIWGGASPIFKFALENIPPFTLAFIRFFFAGLIFLPLAIINFQKIDFRRFLEIFLVGFFGIFINISFFFLGLKKTESINVPIIASSGPVFLYIFSILFLKEKPKLKVFFGMMISLIGVLIIVLSPVFLNGQKISVGEVEGNIFIVLATMGTVFSTLIGKDLLKKINPYIVSAFSFLTSSILFLFFVPNEFRNWNFINLNLNGWIGIIYGVFFSSAIAYFLYYYGISKIQAQEVGIFTYLDPIVAVVIAYFLLGEVPNFFYILGSIFVFGGIYLAEGRFNWHPFHKLKVKN